MSSRYNFRNSAFGASDPLDQLTPEQRAALAAVTGPDRFGGYPQRIPQEMTPVNPNFRTRAEMFTEDVFGRQGSQNAMAIADLLPGAGDALMISDAGEAFGRGDLITGSVLTGGGALGAAFPFMRGPIQKGARNLARTYEAKPAIELTDMPRPRIDATVPRELDVEDRFATTGIYRGAPQGIASEQALGGLRRKLRNSLSRGTTGRDWYERSSESASMLTGGRQGYKDLYSGSVAITSAGAAVPSNQVFGVRGYNQAITGTPIETGRFPTAAARDIDALMSGQPTELGPKRGPFYQALNVKPGEAVERPTNDIWMARAFDYRNPDGTPFDRGLTEAQHRFMDKEIDNLVDWANTNEIGGQTNWTPEKVQASIWVDTKARAEGTDVAAAAYDFSDDLDNLTATINVESEPAFGIDHLAGARDNPELARRLQEGQRQLLSNEQGQDLVALEAGALTRETVPGFGYYKNRSAESDAIRVLAAPGTGSPVMEPGSQRLIEGIAATQGLLRGQESVGYNFIRSGGLTERNAASVNLGRAPLQSEMLTVGSQLDDEFQGAIIPTNTANGINYLVVDDLSGWAVRNDIDPTDAKKVAQGWQKRIREINKTEFDAKPEFGVNSGDLVGSFEAYTPSAYLPAIEGSGVEPQLSRAAQQAAPAMEQLDEALVQEFPDIGTRSQILIQTRQALAEGGVARVRELVDQGILPAVVLGLFGGLGGVQLRSERSSGQGV